MDIKEINKEIACALNEDMDDKYDRLSALFANEEEDDNIEQEIEQENELAELKAKKRIYLKAVDGLEELHEFLLGTGSPSQGLDSETQELCDKIQELSEEIYSRSLAFD